MDRFRIPIVAGSNRGRSGHYVVGNGKPVAICAGDRPTTCAGQNARDGVGLGAKSVLPLVVLCTFLLPLLVGCTTWTKPKLQWPKMPWSKKDDDVKEAPVRMITIWNEAVMHVDGKPPVRGLGGKVFFYGREDKQAIEVDGSLTVYGFDEEGRKRGDSAPDRKFVFPAENLDLHLAESKLGPCYSFWIPWDEAGGPQKKVSLIPRFTPRGGSMIAGEQTTHTLPGSVPPERPAAGQNGYTYPVQQAGFDVPVPGNPTLGPSTGRNEYGRMSTTTIPLSSRMGQGPPHAILGPSSAMVVGGDPQSNLNARRQPVWQGSTVSAGSTGPRSVGSQPGRSRPLGAPIARLDRERGPWRPGPSGPRYDAGPEPEQAPRH